MPGDSLNFTPHGFIKSDLLNYALKQRAGRIGGLWLSTVREGKRSEELGLVNKCLLTAVAARHNFWVCSIFTFLIPFESK